LVSRTNRTARREETIPKGSKVAFSTSALLEGDIGDRTASRPSGADPLDTFAAILDRRSIDPKISPTADRRAWQVDGGRIGTTGASVAGSRSIGTIRGRR
jgi:hypothetical protein